MGAAAVAMFAFFLVWGGRLSHHVAGYQLQKMSVTF